MDFVSLDNHQSSSMNKINERRMKVQKIVKNPIYDAVMNILVALNILSILVKDMIELFGASRNEVHTWLYFQMAITWFFLAEMIFI